MTITELADSMAGLLTGRVVVDETYFGPELLTIQVIAELVRKQR